VTTSILQDLLYFLPEEILLGFGLFLLILDSFLSEKQKSILGKLAALGVGISIVSVCFLWGKEELLFSHLYVLDTYALFFKLLVLSVALLTLFVSFRYLALTGIPQGEYVSLILFATVGMMVMAGGTDLLSIYIGLEITTISSYALVGLLKKDRLSLEGALKYFILGAFNSGFLLYGIALLYGAFGTTNLLEMTVLVHEPPTAMLFTAIALLTAGFAFKISAFPFHMWVPDVYEGSPTPIAGFISVASKAASFAALLRIFFVLLPLLAEWQMLFIVLSILTMTIGNLLALSQESVKRMLAYSSIAHAGYLLIGLASGSVLGVKAILFYFVAYTFMNLGAFSMIVLLAQKGRRTESLDDFKGLAQHHPLWAFCFLVFLLSLAGIPPSAGFIGKFYIFAGAIESGLYGLAVIGVLNSVLAFSYYFRIVKVMYLSEDTHRVQTSPSWALCVSLILLAFLTLLAGLYPVPFLNAAQDATKALLL